MISDDVTVPRTAKFNVGGRIFEVSRSLIYQYPDTILARLVSDTWQKDPNQPVFIDRNSDTFALLLDYLRYGSITLPGLVSKDNFLRDLDFYGVLPEEGSVKTENESWAIETMKRHDRVKALVSEQNEIELENSIELLANYCSCKIVRNEVSTFSKPFVVISVFDHKDENNFPFHDGAKTMTKALGILSCKYGKEYNKYYALFQKALLRYGLRFVEYCPKRKKNGSNEIVITFL